MKYNYFLYKAVVSSLPSLFTALFVLLYHTLSISQYVIISRRYVLIIITEGIE